MNKEDKVEQDFMKEGNWLKYLIAVWNLENESERIKHQCNKCYWKHKTQI